MCKTFFFCLSFHSFFLPSRTFTLYSDCDVSLNEAHAAVPDVTPRERIFTALSTVKFVSLTPILAISDIKKDARVRKIMKIQSHQQLKKFLVLETKKRSKDETKSTCVTKNLDALQWHMFTKKITKWIKMLKKSDDQRRDKLLKKIKIKMFTLLV